MNFVLRALLLLALCAASVVACAPASTSPSTPEATPEVTSGGEQPGGVAELQAVQAVAAPLRVLALDVFVSAPALDRDAKHLAKLLQLQGPFAMAGFGLKPFAPMLVGPTLAGALDLDQPLVVAASMQSLAESEGSDEGQKDGQKDSQRQGVVVGGLRAGYEATLANDYTLSPGPTEGTRLMKHPAGYVPPKNDLELSCLVDDRAPARIACSDSNDALLAHHVEVIARSRAAMPDAILSLEIRSSDWLEALMADEPEMLAGLGPAQRSLVALKLKDDAELSLGFEFDFSDKPGASKEARASYTQMKRYVATEAALPSLPTLPSGVLAAFVTRGASDPDTAANENVLSMALQAIAEELPSDSAVSAEMLSALKEMLIPWQAATGATFAFGQKLNRRTLSKSGAPWGALTVIGEGDKLIASIRDVITMVNKVQGDCAAKDCEFHLSQRAAPRRYKAPKGSVEVSVAVAGQKKAVMVLALQPQGMAMLASADAKTVRKVLAGVLKSKGKVNLTPVQETALKDLSPDHSTMMAGFMMPELALSLATLDLGAKEDRAKTQKIVDTVAKFGSAPVKLSSNGNSLDEKTVRTTGEISFAISSLRAGAAMAAEAMAEED